MGASGPLGTRMKGYEFVQTSNSLLRRVPVIVRVDGRAFHTFTSRFDKPFDSGFISRMVEAAIAVAEEMQGFKFGYVQSDEASFLLTDFDTLTTEAWFGYDLSKVVSISAALMTAYFNKLYSKISDLEKPPIFDARAFNVPLDDVANYFLWRAKDWERNSLQMYARSFFSHKQLYEKNKDAIHETLYSIGKNWTTDLTERERNGTYLINGPNGITSNSSVLPHFDEVDGVLEPLLEFAIDIQTENAIE